MKTTLVTGGAAAIIIAALSLLDPTGAKTENTSHSSEMAATAPAASEQPSPDTSTIRIAPPKRTQTDTKKAKEPSGFVAKTMATLDSLPVKGRAPKTGYSREQFGKAWDDDNRVEMGKNGCDTRNDILNRDLAKIVHKPRTHDCVVLSGVLMDDPYTGNTIPFTRGKRTSSAIQIEHVVAISDAWQKGAQQLSREKRKSFANDPRNLLSVDGPTNGEKSDKDAASWLPPNKAFRCEYVTKQVQVKKVYHLWVTKAEKDAIKRVLAKC